MQVSAWCSDFDFRNLYKGGKRDLTSQSCPLTFICVCAHPQKHTKINNLVSELKIKFATGSPSKAVLAVGTDLSLSLSS